MSGIVIDASFVGLINLPDELPSAEARTLVRTLDGRSLHVPSHWHLEVANMLVKAERRSRITREGRALVLNDKRLIAAARELGVEVLTVEP